MQNKLLKRMSFFEGTLDRDSAEEMILKTELPIDYTCGFESKHPTIYRKPITKMQARVLINTEFYLDINFYEDRVHLNTYSSNDMY